MVSVISGCEAKPVRVLVEGATETTAILYTVLIESSTTADGAEIQTHTLPVMKDMNLQGNCVRTDGEQIGSILST